MSSVVILLAQQTWLGGATPNDPKTAPRAVTPRGELMAEEKSTIALFKQASPSVVNITSIGVERDMFTLNQYQIPQGTGSGFIWDNTGNVITNFHVIQNADAAQVTLADQSTCKARVVGVAPDKDLAVLKIDAPANKLHPIPHRHIERLAGRPECFCHRQSLRSRPDAYHRRDQRAQSRDRIGDAPADPRGDSVRRGDQSRKFRRPACSTAPAV